MGHYDSCYEADAQDEAKKKHKTNNKIKEIVWTDADIDAAYLMGVVNASCHEVDINEPMPALVVIGKEIERLKSLGYKRPYEAIIELRKKKTENDTQ